MYSKCGSLGDALKVFHTIQRKDVVLWTSLISGFVHNGEPYEALKLFTTMLRAGDPNSRTFVAGLKACVLLAADEQGREIDGDLVKFRSLECGMTLHSYAARLRLDSDVYVSSTLIDLYVQCGSLEDARFVFERMSNRDAVSWTSLMLGYVNNGKGKFALDLFSAMQSEGCSPDALAFVAAFKACGILAAAEVSSRAVDDQKLVKMSCLEKGMFIHSKMCCCNVDVEGDLVATALAANGEEETALELFAAMPAAANSRSYVAALKACSFLAAKNADMKVVWLETGMALHAQAAKCGFDTDTYVSNALIDMYAKCSCLLDSRRSFDRIQAPGLVSWNALISACVDNGEAEQALQEFGRMQSLGCLPDARTYVAVLKSAGVMVSVQDGRSVHAEICRRGLEDDQVLVTCIVDFYGRCGRMRNGHQVLNSIAGEAKDLSSWNALIAGYSREGNVTQMVELFHQMQDEGCDPNRSTFVSILTACSHAGLVEMGRRCFEAMVEKHGIRSGIEHYHCLVDLFGRAGQLNSAFAVLKSMPWKPNSVTLITLLDACRKWKSGSEVLEKFAAEALEALDGQPSAS